MIPRRARNHRSGQAALMVTISLPVSLALIGMVVDVGWAYCREEACRTAAQSAAFAAAMAANKAANLTCASGVTCTTGFSACPLSPAKPPSTNLQNGCLYAQQNGFTAGGKSGRQNVKYNANTTTSPVAGVSPAYWVQFMVTERIPTLFAAVLGQSWIAVSARSTGAVFASSVGGCVYVLNHLGQSGAWQQSGGTFATGCGIYVAGSGSVATMSGGTVTLGDGLADSQVKFNLQGTMTKSGGTISPAANLMSNQGSITDPMAGHSLTAPTPGACLPDPSISSGTGRNIPAGTYCSGITISGGTGITLGPGIIDVTGGSITVSGGSISTASGGVNIYFSPLAGNLSVSGGTISITAATGGSLDGIALWKDGLSISSFATSGSTTTINGIIYMPYTAVSYSGGSTPVNQTLIANTIAMSGGTINQSANSGFLSNGGAGGGAFLIE